MTRLDSIAKSCSINDWIFSKLVKNFGRFHSERQASNFVLKEIRRLRLKPAFPPIIATGKNAAEPHHIPSKDFFPGFCIIDIGVRYKGYCSDMTRMLYLGKPTRKELKLYRFLLNVQEKCIAKAKHGVSCKELAEYCAKLLGRYNKYMLHKLGHGVGKQIHTGLKVSPKSKHLLKKGDVITIEPALYFKNQSGMRIEDTIVVGKGRLTKTSKRLLIINHRR